MIENYIPEPNSGCWIFLGYLDRVGYGKITRNKIGHFAHRLSWQGANGPIPAGMKVLHKCDVRCCINPDHLFLGTQLDNVADMRAKGRARYPGANRPHGSKLNLEIAQKIRNDPRFHREIAADYGVSRVAITKIKNNQSWRNK